MLSNAETRANYDAARRGVAPPPAGRPYGATGVTSRRGVFGTFRRLLIIVLLFAALPYIFRIFKNPKALLVIAVVIAIAWWGPRIVKYFKKK